MWFSHHLYITIDCAHGHRRMNLTFITRSETNNGRWYGMYVKNRIWNLQYSLQFQIHVFWFDQIMKNRHTASISKYVYSNAFGEDRRNSLSDRSPFSRQTPRFFSPQESLVIVLSFHLSPVSSSPNLIACTQILSLICPHPLPPCTTWHYYSNRFVINFLCTMHTAQLFTKYGQSFHTELGFVPWVEYRERGIWSTPSLDPIQWCRVNVKFPPYVLL